MQVHAGLWLASLGKYLSLDCGYGVDDVASVPVACRFGSGERSFAAGSVLVATGALSLAASGAAAGSGIGGELVAEIPVDAVSAPTTAGVDEPSGTPTPISMEGASAAASP